MIEPVRHFGSSSSLRLRRQGVPITRRSEQRERPEPLIGNVRPPDARHDAKLNPVPAAPARATGGGALRRHTPLVAL